MGHCKHEGGKWHSHDMMASISNQSPELVTALHGSTGVVTVRSRVTTHLLQLRHFLPSSSSVK